MKKQLFSLVLLFSFTMLQQIMAQSRGEYIDFELVERASAAALDSQVVQATGFPGAALGIEYDVSVFKVSYYTADFDPNELIVATALVAIPTNYDCNEHSIATFGHGLTIKDNGVPSTNNGGYAMITKGLASNGFVVASPDYIYLGEDASPGFQGFQHAASEATATIDLIRAVRTYCAENFVGLNGQIFPTGYSQGGHASMAAAQMMQDEHPFEFTVTALCSGGGTYDLSGIAADSLASPTRTTPERHSLPLVARSYIEAYQDSLPIYGFPADPKAAFDSIFEAPYDSLLWEILQRDNPHFPGHLLDSIPSRMLDDSIEYQFRNNPNFSFRKLLAYNDLYNWVPLMPVRLFQSEDDIEDPIANTYFTIDQFEQNGAPDVQLQTVQGLSHPDAAIPWIFATISVLKEFRRGCPTGINSLDSQTSIELYPNPASDYLDIKTEAASGIDLEISVYNSGGTLLLSERASVHGTHRLDLKNLTSGKYLIAFNSGNGLTSYRMFVVQ